MDIQSNAFSQLLLTTVETFFLSHSFHFTNHGGVGKGCVCVCWKKMKNYGLVIGYRLRWRKRGGNRNSFNFTRSFPQSNWSTQPYLGFFFPFSFTLSTLKLHFIGGGSRLMYTKIQRMKEYTTEYGIGNEKKRVER